MNAMLAAWRARASAREQALIVLGGVVAAAVLGWMLVLAPLERATLEAEARLGDTREALRQARQRAGDLAAFARSAAPAAGADLRGTVERAIAARGLRAAVTALQGTDTRVEITFEAVDFAALTALVGDLGREAKVFPVEALLVARTSPGSVRAEIAFARDAAP